MRNKFKKMYNNILQKTLKKKPQENLRAKGVIETT